MKALITASIKEYYQLAKPGIIYGNALCVVGGFLFGSFGGFVWSHFVGVLLGTAFVIASGCVANNVIDRFIDRKMDRTKNRALPTGRVSVESALLYAVVLGVAGFTSLLTLANGLTAFVGLIGYVFYVVFYSVAKRTSTFGTLVGSVSGATPPVAGYTAATGHFDLAALLLFAVLLFWQMPHFYAIAMYRRDDYKRARLPVLPVVRGFVVTKRHMTAYTVLYIFATILIWGYGYVGLSYVVVMSLLGVRWLYLMARGVTTTDDISWSRSVFGLSLASLLTFCLLIGLNSWLV